MKIYNKDKSQDKKELIFKLDHNSEGRISLICVDENGSREAILLSFKESGLISYDGALNSLFEYDISQLEFNESGALVISGFSH